MKLTLAACRLLIVMGSFPAAARSQVTTRINVQPSGAQVLSPSHGATISADGRLVVFISFASLLVPGDTNGAWDVFVRDVQAGVTTRVSVDSSGVEGNADSGINELQPPPISADGRYVVFSSIATNLVSGDTNGNPDVFLRDLQNGTTERVSVAANGAEGNERSAAPSISADGRYVAFTSYASNLVPGDTNSKGDIFVRDRQLGTTVRVSVDSSGVEGNFDSYFEAISADGRFVAFQSDATNLVPGDTNGRTDIFVHDIQTGVTIRASLNASGGQAVDWSANPSISGDGRYVAFDSYGGFVPGDTNGLPDVYVRDIQNGTTERVSVDSNGIQGNGSSSYATISPDGRYVMFSSGASNLVPGDTNGGGDSFVHDRQTGVTSRVSVGTNGTQGDGASFTPALSPDGRWVAFESTSTNLVAGDTNMRPDIFLSDRAPTGFTSLCDPGSAGVTGCPCSNPPGGPGQGCDNSVATGGAALSASGIGYLSLDSLVFTTSGEKATATSILLQGTGSAPSGIVYGQGVRCVGGTLKRLFVKTAVAGSITAPDFGAGDPTVSARSAAKGDVILPGQSRWYLVYYRDPTVLGGCPASSTYNATQTGRIDWSL